MAPTFFDSASEFREWLEDHHETADELWVGYYKKDADRSGIEYDESVREALCFGWIDGLIHGIDDRRYARRFTPRRPDSIWSRSNVERAEDLLEEGRMRPAGLRLVEAAKESGEWDRAYRLRDDHDVPPVLEAALRESDEAWERFQTFSNTVKHAYIRLVTEAKRDETRTRRLHRLVDLAEAGLTPYDEDGKSRL